MKNKTNQLLAYIAQNHAPATVTSLMKLSYLIDLVAITRINRQISSFTYRRYNYGPFDKDIYEHLEQLVHDNVILEDHEYTPHADEYIVYKFNCANQEMTFGALSDNEKSIIGEVLSSLKGLGAKALSEIAYKTKPMKALKAKPDNDKGLNQVLDLRTA